MQDGFQFSPQVLKCNCEVDGIQQRLQVMQRLANLTEHTGNIVREEKPREVGLAGQPADHDAAGQ